MEVFNVMQTDIEQTCFCCPAVTRLVLIEPTYNVPICFECLLTLAAISLTADEIFDAVERVNRHANN